MASGVKEMNGVVYHGTVSGTTDSYGRLAANIQAEKIIILDAYIQGESYQVTPYRYVSGATNVCNFIVLKTDTTIYTRMPNIEVTIDYFYIKK